METQYLEQFMMLAKGRSMRAVAEELFLSQSALSHNLKKIETELECPMFDRVRNQLILNPYGEIILKHSERIIEEMNAAKREIAEEKKRQTQKIRIGVYAYAFESFVLPNLANAIENHVFECRIWDSARLKAELSKGTLDVIFTDRAPEEDEVEVVRLFKEQIMVSLPSSSEFASRQSLFHSDLAKLNPYLPFDASGYTKWFEQVLKAAGVEAPLANGVSFKEYLYTKDSLERSHMTSSFIMRFLPTAARRVLIPLTEEIGTRDIYMAYQKRSADRLKPLLAYIQTYQDRLFTGSAFLPYFLFPSEQSNLLFCPDSE